MKSSGYVVIEGDDLLYKLFRSNINKHLKFLPSLQGQSTEDLPFERLFVAPKEREQGTGDFFSGFVIWILKFDIAPLSFLPADHLRQFRYKAAHSHFAGDLDGYGSSVGSNP
jgi:hypothetical protein